uniref:Uncharacterized protein n=1 Tax=Siphoviridae sp. ctr2f5 TaxID=2825684 RepID=A0A8S5QF06_9CAUD|nr:MAG TPA: hypothetical protein [Siphoviridae sp. ctr2f5]
MGEIAIYRYKKSCIRIVLCSSFLLFRFLFLIFMSSMEFEVSIKIFQNWIV